MDAIAPGPVEIGRSLDAIRVRIAEAARAAGRRAEDVTLVAVSKTHPAPLVQAALDAGHRKVSCLLPAFAV